MKKTTFKRLFIAFAAGIPAAAGAQTYALALADTSEDLRYPADTAYDVPVDSALQIVYYDRLGLPQTGEASWYGKVFEGRLTSSGERFHSDSLTCAHKTLPFGTLVKVTNLKNDKVVIVKVTDRLPTASHRCIDLTSGAASQLGFLRAGITQVKLEYAGKAPIRDEKKKKAVVPR